MSSKSPARLPGWLDKKMQWEDTVQVKQLLRQGKLRTICEDARCPNMAECFKRRTATFLLLGGHCTRGCAFCNVSRGEPAEVDAREAGQIADTARALGLKFVVLTSVTRDDLPDGGAAHFADAVRTLKEKIPAIKVEVLTPDFQGDVAHIRTVMDAGPDVFAHNVETVRSLTPKVRSRASYDRSLNVLHKAGEMSKGTLIKSGIMVGLGETADEVTRTLGDLKDAGCHAVTIGQYLQPNRTCMQVHRYIEPAVFEEYKKTAQEMGFRKVFAGPYVRSSYLADELFSE